MNIDKDRVGNIFSDLNKYFADLEKLNVSDIKDLENKAIFYASSMLIFSIVNRALDLGSEIIDAKNIGTPSTYRDIFFLFLKEKIITDDLYKELSTLVKYRNALAHEYFIMTEKDVFDGVKRIEAVKKFVSASKKLINKNVK